MAAALLLTTGCINSHPWILQRIAAGDVQYDSRRVIYPARDKVNDIEVEILKTQNLCVLSLAVHGQPVPSCENDPSHTFVNVRIGEKSFRELASLHAGGQRIKLSTDLQQAILAQFRTGGAVEIELPGYKKKIAAGNFPDLAGQLDEPPLFENPIQLPF